MGGGANDSGFNQNNQQSDVAGQVSSVAGLDYIGGNYKHLRRDGLESLIEQTFGGPLEQLQKNNNGGITSDSPSRSANAHQPI